MTNKRYIRRDIVESRFDDLDSIVKLVKADCLIMDYWSSSFYDNFNFKWKEYQKLRNELIEQYDNNIEEIIYDDRFNELKFLSNILINYNTNRSPIDELLLFHIVKEETIEKCLEKLEYNYTWVIEF